MRWKSRISLLVEDSRTVSSDVSVSREALSRLGLQGQSVVWVQNYRIKRPILVQVNDSLRRDVIQMSDVTMDNLCVRPGQYVDLYQCDTPAAKHITLYPVGSTQSLAGRLISDYIQPNFGSSDSQWPLHVDDTLVLYSSDLSVATFEVMDILPHDYGMVTPETIISITNFEEHRTDYVTMDDPFSCAREIQKSIDFFDHSDSTNSLAALASGVKRLIELLQPPPAYSE